MILRVYHSTLNRFDGSIPKRDHYRAVAEVTIADLSIFEALECAFYCTNHINGSWWENNLVTKLVKEDVRSTSVGDLIENIATGEFWLCVESGWNQVLLD